MVASGKALIGQSVPDATANANARGAGLRVIGACYQKCRYVVARTSQLVRGFRVLTLDTHPLMPTDPEVGGAVEVCAGHLRRAGASVRAAVGIFPTLPRAPGSEKGVRAV